MPKNNVTIFTDASFCDATGAGGWACWIKSDLGTHEHSGSFKSKLATSHCAEYAAAANALNVAWKRGFLVGDVHVILVTDCESLQHKLMGVSKKWRPVKYPLQYKALCMFMDIAKKADVSFHVNHIYSHQQVDSPRSWVNDRVDKLAKHHMREGRKNAQS